jgi:hypothetical protein
MRCDSRSAFWVWVGIPEETGPLGILMSGREGNIKVDLKETGWEGVDWIYLAHDRDKCRTVVDTVMNLRFPYNEGNKFTS